MAAGLSGSSNPGALGVAIAPIPRMPATATTVETRSMARVSAIHLQTGIGCIVTSRVRFSSDHRRELPTRTTPSYLRFRRLNRLDNWGKKVLLDVRAGLSGICTESRPVLLV